MVCTALGIFLRRTRISWLKGGFFPHYFNNPLCFSSNNRPCFLLQERNEFSLAYKKWIIKVMALIILWSPTFTCLPDVKGSKLVTTDQHNFHWCKTISASVFHKTFLKMLLSSFLIMFKWIVPEWQSPKESWEAKNIRDSQLQGDCTTLHCFVIFCVEISRKLRLSISAEVNKVKITLLVATIFYITRETCPNLEKTYNEKAIV